MKHQDGFTLIELMITIAILGILLTIAIPAYMDYAVRAKVSEGLMAASSLKTAVAEHRISMGAYPTGNADLGLPADGVDNPSKYVSNLSVGANGVITVDINEGAVGAPADCETIEIVLTPTDTTAGGQTSVDWSCGPGNTSAGCARYLPAECRT